MCKPCSRGDIPRCAYCTGYMRHGADGQYACFEFNGAVYCDKECAEGHLAQMIDAEVQQRLMVDRLIDELGAARATADRCTQIAEDACATCEAGGCTAARDAIRQAFNLCQHDWQRETETMDLANGVFEHVLRCSKCDALKQGVL